MHMFFVGMLQKIQNYFLEKIQSLQETKFVGLLEACLGFLANDTGKLSAEEAKVWQKLKGEFFHAWDDTPQRVIAMVGLIGDGVSKVAQDLAKQNRGMVIISRDAIRGALLKANCTEDKADVIVRRLLIHVLSLKGSVILDSDHVTPWKRRSLNRFLKKGGLCAEYTRVLANPQIAMRWIHDDDYKDTPYDPVLVSKKLKSGGWRLKDAERAKQYAWHRQENGTPRQFRFPHTKVWNEKET